MARPGQSVRSEEVAEGVRIERVGEVMETIKATLLLLAVEVLAFAWFLNQF